MSTDAENIFCGGKLGCKQKVIMENKGQGLGLMGDWEGKSKWYSGQIQQGACIVNKHSNNTCVF